MRRVTVVFSILLGVATILCAPGRSMAQTIYPLEQDIPLPGSAFAAVTTPNGRYVFVSMVHLNGATANGIAIVRQRKNYASLERVFDTGGDTFGLAITRNGKYLVAAIQPEGVTTLEGTEFIDVRKAIAGEPGAILRTVPTSPATGSSIEVGLFNDNSLAFVTNEHDGTVSVIDLKLAIASGGGKNPIVGTIPVDRAPVGLAFSNDGRYLYVTNELAKSSDPGYKGDVCAIPSAIGDPPPTSPGPYGTLMVIDIRQARTDAANSVRASIYAGCSPTRVLLTQNSQIVWVSARDDNDVLAFNARAIRTDPNNALLSTTPVGVAPDGVQPFGNRRYLAVANSNRFYTGQAGTVTILDYTKALDDAGDFATVGTFAAGAFTRQWGISPDGRYLYLTEFASNTLAIFPVGALIKAVK